MIDKPTIIITSLGRTGTKFFYSLFQAILPQSTVLHEPDVLNVVQYRQRSERLRQLRQQIRESGFTNLIVRRMLGQWSLVRLSDALVKGELGFDDAVDALWKQRARFVHTRPGNVYVEANVGYYGLLHILPSVFAHHRAIYLVRDGRDWVRSEMNWGEMYNKGRLRRLVAHTWPTAATVHGDACAAEWAAMPRFERICWAWSRLNGYALQAAAGNPQARVFRFEALFKSPEKYDHLTDMVAFVTGMADVPAVPAGALHGRLEQRVHQGAGAFPNWDGWSPAQKAAFERLCGPLMAHLGYY